MQRYLNKDRRQPDEQYESQADPGRDAIPSGQIAQNDERRSQCFEQHEGRHYAGSSLQVQPLVVSEVRSAHAGEERIVDDLDEPDESDHSQRRSAVQEQE